MTNKTIKPNLWNKKSTNHKKSSVKDDNVMISTSIKDLEEMLQGVKIQTKTTFERMFLPSIIVFGLLALGGFTIIYSITADMTRLANSMDPNMSSHMDQMTNSISELSISVGLMSNSVSSMDKNLSSINDKISSIVTKLDNLYTMTKDIGLIKIEMTSLKPMLNNMHHMNKSMLKMQKSMDKMDHNLNILRNSFQKPMNIFNSIPFI